MVIRRRAIQAEDKLERRGAILDATQRLLLAAFDRNLTMEEVALESGIAKGTVYLYYPSKEELLLALHERDVDGFFRTLIARLEGPYPVDFDAVLEIAHKNMVEPPLFLPLASRCFGLMHQSLPGDAAIAFKRRVANRISRAGAGLEQHFPALAPGAGSALLHHSYALILGLWQVAGGGCALCRDQPTVTLQLLPSSYPGELDCALSALWNGSLGPGC